MEIGPLVTRAVLTVGAADTLRSAAVRMMERGVGSAVVCADGQPTGVITDREALKAVARGADCSKATVGEYLIGKLVTVAPGTEVVEAARIMREKGFRHLVVVDGDGVLVGVFSMRDLVVGLLQERAALRASEETT
ncbi:MAG: CBS domain-containing protein [Acidimicrobiales bacterium]